MKRLIYEDEIGYCRIVVAGERFQQQGEGEAQGLARLHAAAIPTVCKFLAVDPHHIPQDLTFRDAWKMGDEKEPIRIAFPKAIEIHRTRLKAAADAKIEQLNRQLEVAEENDNLPEQVAIKSTKKILRTIHEMNLTHCKTVSDIKNSIPKELKDVWTFYPVPS